MNYECPYCEEPIGDAADAKRFGGRYLHNACHDRFIREWDEAFGDELDDTVRELEQAHLYDDLAHALRFAA